MGVAGYNKTSLQQDQDDSSSKDDSNRRGSKSVDGRGSARDMFDLNQEEEEGYRGGSVSDR